MASRTHADRILFATPVIDPKNYIYLSDHGNDEYINMLAAAADGAITDSNSFDFDAGSNPIVLRSILKNKIMNQCRISGRDFYYVDSGYLGNTVSAKNRLGRKLWHRVVKNGLQHTKLRPRPSDRLNKIGVVWARQQRRGSKIILAAPDEKPCKHYNIDLETWITNTVDKIKLYTDREVVVRQRTKHKKVRMLLDPLSQALSHDVHALVTLNSNAATEAVLAGVPAFVLAPEHAAQPVASTDLSTIENPFWPDQDLIYKWLCHLSYCQFHVSELRHSNIWKLVNDQT